MPTVWVANEAGHPYDKIKDKVGDVEIKPITMGNVNPLRPDRLSWHIGRGLAKFVKEDDFLLISGSPVVNALVLAMWLLRFPTCKLALWDAKAGEYKLATVERSNMESIIQKHLEI